MKDSKGTVVGPVQTGSDGSFSITGTNMSPPFCLYAEGTAGGQAFSLYSVVSSGGTAHINPLTSLLTALASGANAPVDVYANIQSYANHLSSANIQTALLSIKTLMTPLLNHLGISPNTFNPLSGSYSSNHSGIDGMLDAISITVASGQFTITNKLDNTTIATGNLSAIGSVTVDVNHFPSQAVITDIQEIVAMLANFAQALNTANLTPAHLENYFYGSSANPERFMFQDGRLRPNEISSIVDDVKDSLIPALGPLSGFKDVTLLNEQTLGYQTYFRNVLSDQASEPQKVYEISCYDYWGTGNYYPWHKLKVAKDPAGAWKIIGNGYKVMVRMYPTAIKWVKADGSTITRTGLYFSMADIEVNSINSIRVEGPGLPVNGITFTKIGGGFDLDAAFRNGDIPTLNTRFYVMDDTAINAVGTNAQYDMSFYTTNDASGTAENMKLETILDRPLKSTEITAAHFTTFTASGLDHHYSSWMPGRNLTMSLSTPDAYPQSALEYTLNAYLASGSASNIDKDLPIGDQTLSFTSQIPGFSPDGAWFRLETKDSRMRQFIYIWMLQP